MLLVASTVGLCAIGFAAQAGAALWAPAAFTFLAGLGCSIIYPTVISLVGISCKDAQAEAISFSVAGGGVGLFAFSLFNVVDIAGLWHQDRFRELRGHRGSDGRRLPLARESLREG